MSEEIVVEEKVQAISDLRHSLVVRDLNNALPRAELVQLLHENDHESSRMAFLVRRLDVMIKQSQEYNSVMRHCLHLLENSKSPGEDHEKAL